VQICLDAPLSHLCSFARWLPKHAALVARLTISLPAVHSEPQNVDGLLWELHSEAAQQLLQQALQLSTALPAATAAAYHSTAAQQQQQQQQQPQPLRLPNISSVTMPGNAGMLAALPAHSLTHLRILQLWQPVNYAAVFAALSQLRNLQQLYIDDTDISANCPASLVQLSQLTLLELDGFGYDAEEAKMQQLQQLLAQPLPLQVLRMPEFNAEHGLDLSQLTQLLELSLGDAMHNAVFPPQLQQLEVGYMQSEEDLKVILQLQQLQRLSFKVVVGRPEWLLSLAKLPALQSLALQYFPGYYSTQIAADTAAAWSQLPQLRELLLPYTDDSPAPFSQQQWDAICSGISASTRLTKLQLSIDECSTVNLKQRVTHGKLEGLEVCAKLAGLTNLKDLSMEQSHLAPGDALALTALTGLTRLVLALVGHGVNDLVVTAIASSCQQLRRLNLTGSGLG
jgi:hypothetical protein